MAGRVLLIEDNPTNLDLMTYLLQAFGYTVLSAGDGERGLEIASREPLDFILCDMQLPGIDGAEVSKRLQLNPRLCALPRIAVTAMAMVGDRERVLAAGFSGYIAKPIEPETFVSQIEAFVHSGKSYGSPPTKADAPQETQADTPEGDAACILVVDNSPTNVAVICSTLEPMGYRVVAAKDGLAAITLARTATPDLILCDVHMPDHSGFETIATIRSDPRLASIPFAFISSTVWPEQDRRIGLALGALKFITRPIEPANLIAEVEGCLRGGDG